MSVSIQTKEELFAVMEQIAAEREAARPIVQELVASGRPVEDIEIPEGWRTAGMVDELTKAARRIAEADTTRALALAQLALTITEIVFCDYPSTLSSVLKGRAWKEIGYLHLFQNAYEAHFRAMESAQSCFATESALFHDEICTKYGRVGGLIFTRQFPKALEVIDEAKKTFREYGDERRIAMTQLSKATVDHYRGAFASALAEYEQLLSTIEDTNDTFTLASLHLNLGELYAELGRSSEATVRLQEARKLWMQLGLTALAHKAEWGMGRALLAEGKFGQAAEIFRPLRDDFLARKMPEDAGEVALDIVETLVAANEIEKARELTEQVITEFRNANLGHQVITAVGYLRDLLATHQQARQAVKHVRSYVRELRSEPARLLLPIEERE